MCGWGGGTPLGMLRTALLVTLVTTAVAHAQPADPYAPAPPPAPAPAPPPAPTPTPAPTLAPVAEDPVLAEQIAQSLVQRAQELYDARVFVDAKQLAVEALIKRSTGAAAEHARFLIKSINKELGISDAPAVDLTPIQDPTTPPPAATSQPEAPGSSAMKTAARVHGALYGGLLGATIGAFFSKDTPAGGAIPVGIALGVAGGLYLPRPLAKLDWSEAQVRTLGAGSMWGGVLGGLFVDAAGVNTTNARQVLVGASIGSTLGVLGGVAMARRNKLTRGDVALIDTLSGVGAVGGLTLGMLMQPAEGEAYSVNSILGTAGGLLVGYVAAPLSNTTPRRMLRVAGVAALGGGAPFLLYAAIRDTKNHKDERIVGALSSIGLVAGLYVGFRITRGLDADLDVLPGTTAPVDDAPPAVVGRTSTGRWALGALAIQPLSLELAPQPGLAVPVVAGRFR